MLLPYIAIAVMIAVATFIAVAAIGLGELFGPKKKTKVKEEPYESGFAPIGPGTRRMPVRFYLIAVLFILFDIEVIFFLPWQLSSVSWVCLDWWRWLCLSLSYWWVTFTRGKKEH